MIQANMTSTKSDLDAKTAFCKCLEDRGFTTEIRQAPAHYRFVICQKLPDDSFHFIELTPAEMMEYSTIPPFKVFFNVPLDGRRKKVNGKSKALHLTEEAFKALNGMYKNLKG